MGKVAYINRCILMDNLHIPSSGLTTQPKTRKCANLCLCTALWSGALDCSKDSLEEEQANIGESDTDEC